MGVKEAKMREQDQVKQRDQQDAVLEQSNVCTGNET
jgi:hypothetical protein